MRYSCLFLFILFFVGWKIEDNSPITCLRLRKIMPMIDDKGFVKGADTQDIRIFYKGDERIYKTPYLYDSIVDKRVLKSETRYRYFVFNKDSSFGSIITQNGSFSRHFPRDSFTFIKRFLDLGIYESIENKTLKLVSSTIDKSTGDLIETYIGNQKTEDRSVSGKAYFSYSKKLKGIDLSISNDLDSIKNAKLYQVKILTDPRPNSSKTPYVTFLKIEWIKDFDRKVIDRYFKRSN